VCDGKKDHFKTKPVLWRQVQTVSLTYIRFVYVNIHWWSYKAIRALN